LGITSYTGALMTTSAPLHFPGFTPLAPSGRCGKKNCLASVTLGGVPMTLHFGGSGDPDLPPAESLRPGDEVSWKYNNMVATVPLLRWIVGRLDPSQRSIARLGERLVSDRSVLTVVYVRLHLIFQIRRLRISFRLPAPLEFELDAIVDENHFRFKQVSPPRAIGLFGLPLAKIASSSLDVTGPRGISIAESQTIRGVAFTVQLEPGISSVSGPLVWMLHDPNDRAGPLLVGEVAPTGEIRVSGCVFRAIPDTVPL
jgi:hypothetical protein